MAFSDFIVFVDESGDHSLESINPEYPIFVLAFCIVDCKDYVERITPNVRGLKFRHFGHDMVILHELDIRKRIGAFASFNREKRDGFMAELAAIIADVPMTIVAIVIDKLRYRNRYSVPAHPYHFAMQFGLERISHFLREKDQMGRATHIIFEARGRREDKDLKLNFRSVCEALNGGAMAVPLEIKVADKRVNSEGLQLADLVARPIGLRVLRPAQENRAWQIIERKLWIGVSAAATHENGLKISPAPEN
jgi:hypothetical protein